MSLEGIALAGSFAGVFIRTMIDYIRVRAQTEQTEGIPLEFDKKFMITAILAAGSAGTFAVVSASSIMDQIPANSTPLSAFIFAMSAGLGVAINHGFNLAVSTGKNTIKASTSTITKLKAQLFQEKMQKEQAQAKQ